MRRIAILAEDNFKGIALNYIGILKMIDWMKDENTPYVFPARCLVPGQQKTHAEQL